MTIVLGSTPGRSGADLGDRLVDRVRGRVGALGLGLQPGAVEDPRQVGGVASRLITWSATSCRTMNAMSDPMKVSSRLTSARQSRGIGSESVAMVWTRSLTCSRLMTLVGFVPARATAAAVGPDRLLHVGAPLSIDRTAPVAVAQELAARGPHPYQRPARAPPGPRAREPPERRGAATDSPRRTSSQRCCWTGCIFPAECEYPRTPLRTARRSMAGTYRWQRPTATRFSYRRRPPPRVSSLVATDRPWDPLGSQTVSTIGRSDVAGR